MMRLMDWLSSTLKIKKKNWMILEKERNQKIKELSDRNDKDIPGYLSTIKYEGEMDMTRRRRRNTQTQKQKLEEKEPVAAEVASDGSTEIDLTIIKEEMQKVKDEVKKAKDEIIDDVKRIFNIRDPVSVEEDLAAITKEIEALRLLEGQLSGKLVEHLKLQGANIPGLEMVWGERGIRTGAIQVRSRRLIKLAQKKQELLLELADATRKVIFQTFALENNQKVKGWDQGQRNSLILWVE